MLLGTRVQFPPPPLNKPLAIRRKWLFFLNLRQLVHLERRRAVARRPCFLSHPRLSSQVFLLYRTLLIVLAASSGRPRRTIAEASLPGFQPMSSQQPGFLCD